MVCGFDLLETSDIVKTQQQIGQNRIKWKKYKSVSSKKKNPQLGQWETNIEQKTNKQTNNMNNTKTIIEMKRDQKYSLIEI